ncbi:MAG: ankyrin repeat domain-containing protein [Solirubrobacteraceae bacterium]
MPAPLHAYCEDFGYYEERAQGLLASAKDGTPSATQAFAEHGVPLTEHGARAVIAAQHGVGSWKALRTHVAALRASDAPFHRAYRAVERRDLEALGAVLDAHPELVRAKGTNGNDLLGMAGAVGDERLSELLLQRGADPTSANLHGWTALHQAAYSNQPQLAARLLAAGARTDLSARGDGGTPLIVALFWGHREAAELLAGDGVVPANLRAAAGLGDLGLIAELLPATGKPTAAAGAHRDFYRPHGGFPAWSPSDDPREILDEALAWAARNDRVEAIDALVQRGARLAADVYRGTALAWAAATGRERAIRRLVALGADPSGPSTFGGPDHGRALTPLHLAAEDCRLDALTALLELGADPTLTDGIYESTPAGWAEHFGQARALATLQAAGG